MMILLEVGFLNETGVSGINKVNSLGVRNKTFLSLTVWYK